MTSQPSLSISMVRAEVLVELPAGKRRRRIDPASPPSVSLEIGTTGCRVWDNATYTVCGEHYRYTPETRPEWREHFPNVLTDIPYFDAVFRYLSEQYAANRTNPLGAFLRNAVVAMEAALAERDGSCVYFAEANGRVKIGWSKRVATRVAELQTANASPIRLLGVLPGGRALERRLHEMFAHARLSGEWFEATPDLRAYIEARA